MEAEIAAAVPIRGLKRTADLVLSPPSKRARSSPAESSDEESSSDESEREGISTPSTPATPSSRQKRLECTWPGCDKTFSRPIHLAEHVNSHKGVRTHACQQCDKKFFRASHLQHHVKNAHTTVREYLCRWEGCGKAFGTGTRLRRHVATHTKQQQYACDRPSCGQSFRKHATLQKHIATAHEGRSPFVCDKPCIGDDGHESTQGAICGAGFQTQGKLRTHHGRVHGLGRYWCTICSDPEGPMAFSTYTAFRAHNANIHPPTCSQCLYVAVSNKELRQHLKQAHDIADPNVAADAAAPPPATIRCDRADCNKTFSRRANLLTHIKSVHDGRRFVCGEVPLTELNHVDGWDASDACGKDLTSKGSLESHIRAVHMKQANPQRRKAKAEAKAEARKGAKAGAKPKKPRKNNTRVSTAAAISGTGYAEVARPLACFVTGCAFRFVRAYDRALHARTRHGLGEAEIAALGAAASAAAAMAAAAQSHSNSNGTSVGEGATPLDPALEAEDLDSDSGQGALKHNDHTGAEEDQTNDIASEKSASEYDYDYEEELEQGAAAGGVFWLGGGGSGSSGAGRDDATSGFNPDMRSNTNTNDIEDDDANEWDAWEQEEMFTVVHGGDDAEDEDEDAYDFTLEDEIPYAYNDDNDYDDYRDGGREVTGTGGQVNLMLLG